MHIFVSAPPNMAPSEIMKRVKGRSARKLLQEYGELKKKYYGGHLWGIGYGAWSSGNITKEMINEYLDHHQRKPNGDDNFILED